MQTRIMVVGLVLVSMCIGACVEEPRDDEGSSLRSLTGGGELVDAGPGGGTWLGNGLEEPDVSGLDPAYGLNTGHGLRADGGLLSTEDGRDVARYVVECALPLGDSITKMVDGQMLVFDGFLGLAPQWKVGACGEGCQQWVSACLLARTNVSGHTVDLWVAADHPSIGLGLSAEYPLHEATFYGNLFADPPEMYFCHGSEEGVAAALADGRTCTGPNSEDCGFTTFGSCFEPARCAVVDDDFPTECAQGDPAAGAGYHSLSTFVSLPEE